MAARSAHPILTDLVLSAMVRISLVDDLVDVLEEGLGVTDGGSISSFFDENRADCWDEADLDARRAMILEFAAR